MNLGGAGQQQCSFCLLLSLFLRRLHQEPLLFPDPEQFIQFQTNHRYIERQLSDLLDSFTDPVDIFPGCLAISCRGVNTA